MNSSGLPQRTIASQLERSVQHPLADYFRCPTRFVEMVVEPELTGRAGYFTFDGVVGYGQYRGFDSIPAPRRLARSAGSPYGRRGEIWNRAFPIQPGVSGLQLARGTVRTRRPWPGRYAASYVTCYYLVRPALPFSMRKRLQRIGLSDWQRIPFPRWPVDCSADDLMHRALATVLKASRIERLPFIWFWPDGAPACAMVTHDVEGPTGHDFCDALMDLNDSFGVKAAFQVIPSRRRAPITSLPRGCATAASRSTCTT